MVELKLEGSGGYVKLSVRTGGGEARITVEDNGGGFKAESLGQVFDPYVTSKPKGTGLGLAIVKKLVEEHMGSITAENTKNNGALIRILLPKNERYREILLSEIKSKQDIGRAIG